MLLLWRQRLLGHNKKEHHGQGFNWTCQSRPLHFGREANDCHCLPWMQLVVGGNLIPKRWLISYPDSCVGRNARCHYMISTPWCKQFTTTNQPPILTNQAGNVWMRISRSCHHMQNIVKVNGHNTQSKGFHCYQMKSGLQRSRVIKVWDTWTLRGYQKQKRIKPRYIRYICIHGCYWQCYHKVIGETMCRNEFEILIRVYGLVDKLTGNCRHLYICIEYILNLF